MKAGIHGFRSPAKAKKAGTARFHQLSETTKAVTDRFQRLQEAKEAGTAGFQRLSDTIQPGGAGLKHLPETTGGLTDGLRALREITGALLLPARTRRHAIRMLSKAEHDSAGSERSDSSGVGERFQREHTIRSTNDRPCRSARLCQEPQQHRHRPHELRQWKPAIAALEQSCILKCELGDPRDIAQSLHNLGKLHFLRENYASAESAFLESFASASAATHPAPPSPTSPSPTWR